MMTLGGGRIIITLRAADRDRGMWSCEVIVGSDLLSLHLVLSLYRWRNVGHGRLFVITCKTCFTSVNDPDNHIRMTYVSHPDVLWKSSACFMLISVVCPSLRQSGYEKRITCIRIGVIWMIMRVTCYYEVCGTCSQEEGSLQCPPF